MLITNLWRITEIQTVWHFWLSLHVRQQRQQRTKKAENFLSEAFADIKSMCLVETGSEKSKITPDRIITVSFQYWSDNSHKSRDHINSFKPSVTNWRLITLHVWVACIQLTHIYCVKLHHVTCFCLTCFNAKVMKRWWMKQIYTGTCVSVSNGEYLCSLYQVIPSFRLNFKTRCHSIWLPHVI